MSHYPINRGLIQDTAKTSGADFFATDLSPKFSPSTFRIMISVDTATRLSATIENDSTEMTAHFNAGVDLTADCLYIFDLLVHQGDTVNFEVDDTVNVDICRVQEIDFP